MTSVLDDEPDDRDIQLRRCHSSTWCPGYPATHGSRLNSRSNFLDLQALNRIGWEGRLSPSSPIAVARYRRIPTEVVHFYGTLAEHPFSPAFSTGITGTLSLLRPFRWGRGIKIVLRCILPPLGECTSIFGRPTQHRGHRGCGHWSLCKPKRINLN